MDVLSITKNLMRRVVIKIERAAFWTRYIAFDRIKDRVLLNNYVDDIQNAEMVSDKTDGSFAIFVYYEPGQTVSASVQRIIRSLAKADVNIILMSNHALSDEQHAFFRDHCHTLIRRGNQGFDFGCYKDAIKFIGEKGLSPERLIILNDSVFYASPGLDDFVAALDGEEDVIAAYENWGEDYHLQSFSISVSHDVLTSRPFQQFWKSYIPSNNRVLAIELGEKQLSYAILESAKTTKVIYSVDQLYRRLLDSGGVEESMLRTTVAVSWRGAISPSPINIKHRVVEVCGLIARTSTIHSGAYFFPKYMASPIYKKDLVYRGRFRLWEVGAWLQDIMPADEREEFLNLLRQKGDSSQLTTWDKFKFRNGLK
ncbi:rhamnan synthesis F family protein [uncultured Aliiroseovarius sp.]|uniref:rhamnan synthesis F family protein n=1 Tax=uncultured Aliiroseovarius sp. TaxID=1658783 RepID=UPI0025918392|nr:rhamnan synthesis F family protein [uncultured Aliiroseovarius sp.]